MSFDPSPCQQRILFLPLLVFALGLLPFPRLPQFRQLLRRLRVVPFVRRPAQRVAVRRALVASMLEAARGVGFHQHRAETGFVPVVRHHVPALDAEVAYRSRLGDVALIAVKERQRDIDAKLIEVSVWETIRLLLDLPDVAEFGVTAGYAFVLSTWMSLTALSICNRRDRTSGRYCSASDSASSTGNGCAVNAASRVPITSNPLSRNRSLLPLVSAFNEFSHLPRFSWQPLCQS